MENKKHIKEIVRNYTGDTLLKIPESVYDPLVEGIIHHGDLVIMAGTAKSNKSTFALQLACSVSTGASFLGSFKIPKPGVVWYFSTEGKDDETRERLIRMSKAVPIDTSRFRLFCSTQFKLNTETGLNKIKELVVAYEDNLPDLIIIDSVYSGFKGKLTDEDIVNDYITVLRGFSELCNDAGVFLYHHLRKPGRDRDGVAIPQTDEDTFGSVFFLGQADHVFVIEKSRKSKMDRVVTCATQRSGRIVENIHLHLNEPDPFYLSLVGAHDQERDLVIRLLRECLDGLSMNEVIQKTGLSKSLAYIVVNELEEKNLISRTRGYKGKITLLGARETPK